MNGLLPRLLVGLLGMVAGGLVGSMIGGEGRAVLGALLGGLLGFAAIVVFDAVRGWRLLHWLRGAQDTPAPRDSGFWGEVGYRIERSLRALSRRAEAERLRLSQFVAAMEASPNGVLLLDAGDQIEWCNSRAADHFGLDPQRDRRQRVTNLIRSPAFVAYLQAGNFDEPVTFHPPRGPGTLQVTIRRYDGDLRLVLSQDLTERERAEAMRRDFVANVSHEIRTPLTVLSGFLETLRNLPLDEVEQKRVIMLMTQQAERMGHLVTDLLVLARLEGSPRPGADRWVGVDSLFAQVEAEARALSAGRHVIAFAAAPGAAIAGAESELQSALGNLVGNAVRYTPDGGRIDVGWRLADNGSGEIAVADSGPGIARVHLSRLTERFYRVDGGRSRESGGTGLGLAIVKHVMQRHGGELDIASEPGKGSTFRLVFPPLRVRVSHADPTSGFAAPADAAVKRLTMP
ncbi:MAG TPA: phosphate regulon sensor histidine kinase PhoR [Caldimonas sp.]|nr:phosphate regulon sensor histidine kinase PhoR [Caldimonas sp.]HEV7576619.1 phosphate regulon sensor histidine kinase PhoR [Caldimonas sp.]